MSTQELFVTNYTSLEQIEILSKAMDEPDWLFERRKQAFELFKDLPYDQDTLFYKYTSWRKFSPDKLTPISEVTFSKKNENNFDIIPEIFEENNNLSIQLNQELIDKGVIFDSLHNLIKTDEELAKSIVDRVQFSEEYDKLGSLARAFATNIIVLYIPKGVIVDKSLLKITELESNSYIKFVEFIGIFEEDSQVNFMEIFRNKGEDTENLYMNSQTLLLEDNAIVNFNQIQDWGQKTVYNNARDIKVGRYAQIHGLSHNQGGDMTRLNSTINLEGVGSEGYDLFVNFGNKRQRFDVKAEIIHIGRDTIGQVHNRSVMMGRSESILRGIMNIPKSAINADSWLSSQGLTVDKGKIVAIPALKIDQNEIKAAHAASVEPLNEDLIFYLETRGVSHQEAKEMLIKGYFNDVINRMKVEELSNVSREYLSRKWDKIF